MTNSIVNGVEDLHDLLTPILLGVFFTRRSNRAEETARNKNGKEKAQNKKKVKKAKIVTSNINEE